MTTMITAGTVVTANSRMEVWQPGYMIVRDSRIAEAGPGPGPDGDFDERIDARSSVVMPGLVNGHSLSRVHGRGCRSRYGGNTFERGGANIRTKRSTSVRSSASSRCSEPAARA
jgi:dihydroorotase-like cyclic amidohydrolase